ncbi:MAG: tetratricopeptide repeat protein [Aestuariivirga sp.]
MTSDTGQTLFAAERMLDVGNADKALEGAMSVLGREPENPRALALATRCHIAMEDWDEAEAAIDSLMAAEPESAQGLILRLAIADRNKPRGKKTLAAAQNVLAVDPESAIAWNLRAVAHDNLGAYDEAEHAYRQAIEFEPDDVDFLASFADFLSKTGRKEEAQSLMQRAAELEPDSVSVLVASGTEDLRAGRPDEAMEKALWALQQDPNDQSAIGLLVSIKTARSPVMGIWWRWASLMERMSNGQRWAVVIGLYLVWQVFSRTILKQAPDYLQIAVVALWVGFCILTWVGPSLFRKAIAREMEKVKIKQF